MMSEYFYLSAQVLMMTALIVALILSAILTIPDICGEGMSSKRTDLISTIIFVIGLYCIYIDIDKIVSIWESFRTVD